MSDELDEDWQHRDENIETIRAELRAALATAHSAVCDAMCKIGELRGDTVYDVEYAEGSAGRDMLSHLDTAATAIRAVEALGRAREAGKS